MDQSSDAVGTLFSPLSLSFASMCNYNFAREKDLKSFWQFQAFDLLLLFFFYSWGYVDEWYYS